MLAHLKRTGMTLFEGRKAKTRRQALKARKAAFSEDPKAGEALISYFPDAAWPPLNSIVAGYWPLRDEIDPRPLMEVFYCEQVRMALPCVEAPDHPLVFRSWQPGAELKAARFGVQEPDPSLPDVRPSLVLVPLVAFDEKGGRLGYGGGYYDRTLAALSALGPVTTVGLAYEAQKVKAVPKARFDVALDWIVTEKRAYQGAPRA